MSNQEQKDAKVVAPKWVHALGGGLGSLCGAVITSPLEVVKTRLQAKNHNTSLQTKFSFGFGTFSSLRVLFQEEGFRGLYRGLGAHVVGVVPSRAIQLLVYGNTKTYLEKHYSNHAIAGWIPAIAAGFGGFVVVSITQPIWMVKTRLQLQTVNANATIYNGMVDCFLRTAQNEGPRALYKGLGASYLGLCETIIQFSIYEWSKKKVLEGQAFSGQTTAAIIFGLSAVAKLIASVLTYPHEVIRTRLREERGVNIKYKGPIHGMYVMAMEEGTRGLYAGLGPHLLRVVPNSAILLAVYELTLHLSTRFQKHKS